MGIEREKKKEGNSLQMQSYLNCFDTFRERHRWSSRVCTSDGPGRNGTWAIHLHRKGMFGIALRPHAVQGWGAYGIIYRISLASVMSASCDCCWQAGWPLVGELANFQCHPSEEYVGFAPHHILHTGFFPERVRRTNRRNITSRMK